MKRGLLSIVIVCASCFACSNGPTTRPESLPSEPIAAEEQPPIDERIELPPFDLLAKDAGLEVGMALVLKEQRGALLLCFAQNRGEVLLHLELRSDGRVLGGSTEPVGGEEGLAAVADCVLSAARTWRFPRGEVGGTRVLVAPLFSRASDES